MGPVVALRPCSVRPHLQQARLPDAHRPREGLLEALAPTSAGVQSVSGALAQLLCPEAVCEEHSQVRSQRQQREGQARYRLGNVATEMSTAWRAHRRHQACLEANAGRDQQTVTGAIGLGLTHSDRVVLGTGDFAATNGSGGISFFTPSGSLRFTSFDTDSSSALWPSYNGCVCARLLGYRKCRHAISLRK